MAVDRNKRLSECTEAEKDEGAFLWLSENYYWERKELHPVMERAVRYVGTLRGRVAALEAERGG